MLTNAARNYKVKFRMLRRYRKIKEDMPLSAAKIEDDTLASEGSASKQMSFISFYLQGKRNLRNLNYKQHKKHTTMKKRLHAIMTAIMLAALSFSFTSCEDEAIASSLQGTWEGNMYISSE